MKFFLDTEFIEHGYHSPITLLSVGIVAEDGSELYCVSNSWTLDICNPWVIENVVPYLGEGLRLNRPEITRRIKDFITVCGVGKPEFWGYYADYDWVVFCQLFGAMIDLPKGWPMYCRDIKQWCDQLGNPKLPEKESKEHHALNDARWNKKAWEFLNALDQ